MGIPAWVWFVIAAVSIGAGIALLVSDRAKQTPNNRERRRWAALRGWQFAETDKVLPTRWQRGVLGEQGGTALDVVAGSTFTADGRRQVYFLDLDLNGKVTSTIVAVRCRRPVSATIELWLPDVPVPQDTELDLLGPVGSRYAFVTDVAAARPLVTPDMVDTSEEIGSDVTVVWMEHAWVLAALDPDEAEPTRLEQLLRRVGELADLVDPFETNPNEPETPAEEPAEELAEPAQLKTGVQSKLAEVTAAKPTPIENTDARQDPPTVKSAITSTSKADASVDESDESGSATEAENSNKSNGSDESEKAETDVTDTATTSGKAPTER